MDRSKRAISVCLAGLTLASPAVAATEWTIGAPASISAPISALQATDAPELTPELFRDPPASVRPKYRWWIPRGGADGDELERELVALKAAGAGGAEISPFYDVGGAQQTGQGLIATGWESEAWHQLRLRLYEVAAREGFLIDDTLSGLGSDAVSVPTAGGLDSPGNSKRAVGAYSVLWSGQSYDGALPEASVPPVASALCREAEAGSDRIQPVLTHWLEPGDQIQIGDGEEAEQAVVQRVGDGTWGCGLTQLPLRPGDERIFVTALAGGGGMDRPGVAYTQFNVGEDIQVGTAPNADTVRVLSLGEAPAAQPVVMLNAASAGAVRLHLAGSPNTHIPDPVRVGHHLLLGRGDTAERVRVATVSHDAEGLVVGLVEALSHDQQGTATDLGSGIAVSPLGRAHDSGAPVITVGPQGEGIVLSTPLRRDHGLGARMSASARQTVISVMAMRCVAHCDADEKVLDPTTHVDLTSDALDGRIDDLTWRTDDDWVIYALRMVDDPPFDKGAFSPRGFDFAVDHLSRQGADALTAYWSETVLTPRARAAIAANPAGLQTLFEDSLEMPFTQKWTADFLTEWHERRGYDPTPLLPALFHTDQQARVPSGPFAGILNIPGDRFLLEGIDVERVREDYRQIWSDLFRERFVAPIEAWAQRQSLGFRLQAYGSFPIDTSWASSAVSVPEGEALGFDNDVNTYSIVASAAHMAGRSIVSNECCAQGRRVYQRDLVGPDGALTDILQAFAGGVNQQIWHGFNYRESAVATWPGRHAWSAQGGTSPFSENFTEQMPAWSTGGVRSVNDAIARLSLVLRQGAPRTDLAVYHHVFGRGLFQGPEAPTITASGALARSGLSLGFISPEYLKQDPERVWNGRALFAQGAAYKGLILSHQHEIPPEVAQTLVALVESGMPLLVIGELPYRATGYDPDGRRDAVVRQASTRLRTLIAGGGSVAQVADENAALPALERLGIDAAAAKHEPSSTLSVHRLADAADYYFLYNNSDAPVTDRWTFAGAGSPVRLDPWSGEMRPIPLYERDPQAVAMDVMIGPRDVAIVALMRDRPPTQHITALDGGEAVGLADGGMVLRGGGGRLSYRLSHDGEGSVNLTPAPEKVEVSNWALELTSWQAHDPQAVGTEATETDRRVLGDFDIVADAHGVLPAWRALKPAGAFDAVSGVGVYTSHFLAPQAGPQGGAYLDLGMVAGLPSVRVNGHAVVINLQDPSRMDIGSYLRQGDNVLTVSVASNLNNAVGASPPQDYGLHGPVRVTFYSQATIIDPAGR